METTEGFETHMRDVLHGADDQAAGFTAAQVIAKGRNRRRARTATVSGVALVAAGAVAVVPAAVGTGRSHGGAAVVSAAGGPVSTSAPSSAVVAAPNPPASSAKGPATTPTPSARVVSPGTISLGDGYSLTLTSDSLTVGSQNGQSGPNYTDNGNQGPASIGIQQCGRLIAGLYLGDGQAATGTVTVDGKAYPTTVVTLAGHPGWSVAYAMLPAFPSRSSKVTISVSDAAGHQLASYAPPQVH